MSMTSAASGVKQNRQIQIFSSILLAPWPTLVALFLNPAVGWMGLTICSLVVIAVTLSAHKFGDEIAKYLYALGLVTQCVLFTASLAGHAWQIDSHMLYFVVIAISSTMYDRNVLLFTAGVIAVHHLTLTFALPILVYPDGTLMSNVQRTVFHAVVVVTETAALTISIYQKQAADRTVTAESEAAREQTRLAQEARQEATESRVATEQVVATLSNHLARLSDGDLTAQIQSPFPDAQDQIRIDFNQTVGNLNVVMDRLASVAGNIRRGATEISSASTNLSQRTENQAATLEQSAAALEEMTSGVSQAAEGAQQVESQMNTAREETLTSESVVQEAVQAMNEIETSATQISQIIGVIDSIAFQTSLLALNAGVEAARAGEAGGGFAVVASEVRGLAQRSAESALEIKALIDQSAGHVEQGVEQVGRAGKALADIRGQVSAIAQQISSIAESASTQSSGLKEINTGMTHLDTVTQQNAAMVEQSTAACQLLQRDAGELAEIVAQFKLTDVTASPTADEDHLDAEWQKIA
ncbi:MAG: methyl-accepting chemotaxis protein [Pelagimonas sp.]